MTGPMAAGDALVRGTGRQPSSQIITGLRSAGPPIVRDQV